MRLFSDVGELVPVRGGCVNKCAYCARLAAVENTEMLALDAMEGDAPAVWLVLTTSIATLDMSEFYGARTKLVRAIRRRWPRAQYAALLEFTTGYAATSGGKRRPHWNLLLKGVTLEDVAELRELVARVWCPAVSGKPAGQYVGEISDAGGLMRYIALHFQKCSQSPPEGFSGQRFNCSREYFTGCTRATARARARQALRLKRELWRAESAGAEGEAALAQAEAALAEGNRRVWVLTTDRAARLSAVQNDPLRRALPSERVMWSGWLSDGRVSLVVGVGGLEAGARVRAKLKQAAALRRRDGGLRLFDVYVSAVSGKERVGALGDGARWPGLGGSRVGT